MLKAFHKPAVEDHTFQAQGVTASVLARSAESWGIPERTSQRELTFEEMRACGVRDVLIYCSNCRRSTTMNADRWSDDLFLSDIGQLFTCQACDRKDVDVRPDWEPAL